MEEPRVIRDDVLNERGELTFAEQTRMTRGRCWGAERLINEELDRLAREHRSPEGFEALFRILWLNGRATPDDDPWYDVLPGSPVLPDVDTAGWGSSRGGHGKSRG